MHFGLNPPTAERVDSLLTVLERIAVALEANAAAAKTLADLADFQANGPR